MTKDELLRLMADNRDQINALLDDVQPEDLVKPGAYGIWSVKDVLVHISRWESEMIKVLFQSGQEGKPQSDIFNPEFLKVNEIWYQESKDRELGRVQDDFVSVRKQLVRRIEEIPEQSLTDPARYPWMKNHPLIGLVKDIVLDHEEEHLEGLKTWHAALAKQ